VKLPCIAIGCAYDRCKPGEVYCPEHAAEMRRTLKWPTPAPGYERESEPYRMVLGEGVCDRRAPQYVPFRKLGPTLWVAIGLVIGMCVGMVCGAGAKHCLEQDPSFQGRP
jgi:hypothetical protein